MSKPGFFTATVNAKFSDSTKVHNFDYKFKIRSFSKLKLNNLKISVTNTNEKNDEKETLVEFPKRSFKTIKATQKSIIRLKVSVIKNKLNNFFLFFRLIMEITKKIKSNNYSLD